MSVDPLERINVTKTFLPPINEYQVYIEQIWASSYLSNQGPLLQEFEKQSSDYLGVSNFQLVTNGTLALQLALRSLDITEGEVITTPFSYVATTSAILWEGCSPVYVDIDPQTFCIDPAKIEAAITSNTKAIMAVHVFGYPCDIEKIQQIADKHNLKVIYDGAHAFGAEYKGKSLLSYGDVSTCSFHATKLFHTIEGGAVITADKTTSDKLNLLKRFGHFGDEHYILGINAKASEFQAAMGLCNLVYLEEVISNRRAVSKLYDSLLSDELYCPQRTVGADGNFGYYPVVFENEKHLLEVVEALGKRNIFPRRYFYPSLNLLPYLNSKNECGISEQISLKILCLPLYPGLNPKVVKQVCEIVNQTMN